MHLTHDNKYLLTIDTGVPVPKCKGVLPMMLCYGKALLSMHVGDSFFLPHRTSYDVDALLTFGSRIGVTLLPITTDNDEIYLEAGVRVWRTTADWKLVEDDTPIPVIEQNVLVEGIASPEVPTTLEPANDLWWYARIGGSAMVWQSRLPITEQKLPADVTERAIRVNIVTGTSIDQHRRIYLKVSDTDLRSIDPDGVCELVLADWLGKYEPITKETFDAWNAEQGEL